MTLSLSADPIPLNKDPDGTLRVGNSRVTLDCLANAFQEGATPEIIVEQFPSLQLADVYMVLGYLLRHPQFFEEYLQEGQQIAHEHRVRLEKLHSPSGIRERLLARQGKGK